MVIAEKESLVYSNVEGNMSHYRQTNSMSCLILTCPVGSYRWYIRQTEPWCYGVTERWVRGGEEFAIFFPILFSPTMFPIGTMIEILHMLGPLRLREWIWLLHWHQNKWMQGRVSLLLSLDCRCVHRPPPALPIPLLIMVMSEKRSSGRGCWQGFDWMVVLAHTSKMKRLLL